MQPKAIITSLFIHAYFIFCLCVINFAIFIPFSKGNLSKNVLCLAQWQSFILLSALLLTCSLSVLIPQFSSTSLVLTLSSYHFNPTQSWCPSFLQTAACVGAAFNHQSQLVGLCLCGFGRSPGQRGVLIWTVALPVFRNSEGRATALHCRSAFFPSYRTSGGALAVECQRPLQGGTSKAPLLAWSWVALDKCDCWINKSAGRLTRTAD